MTGSTDGRATRNMAGAGRPLRFDLFELLLLAILVATVTFTLSQPSYPVEANRELDELAALARQ